MSLLQLFIYDTDHTTPNSLFEELLRLKHLFQLPVACADLWTVPLRFARLFNIPRDTQPVNKGMKTLPAATRAKS